MTDFQKGQITPFERLFLMGLLDDFEVAAHGSNPTLMSEILGLCGIDDQTIAHVIAPVAQAQAA